MKTGIISVGWTSGDMTVILDRTILMKELEITNKFY